MRLACLLAAACLGLALMTGSAQARTHLNAYALQGDFMCVVCHEPLNQVNDAESEVEKQTLSQLVNQGLTLGQIKAQMVDDYTEQVLAEPPAHGINLLVYVLPPAFLLAGIGLLAYNLPRWRRRTKDQRTDVAGPADPPLDDVDSARLDRELAEFDR